MNTPAEEKLTTTLTETIYSVKIKKFHAKMQKWDPGKKVELNPFPYKDNLFSLLVYPNGDDEKNRGFVSLFLKNEGKEKIKVDCELKLDMICVRLSKSIQPGIGQGYPKFYPHNTCAYYGSTAYNKLEIICTIMDVWNNERVFDDIVEMKRDVAELKKDVALLKTTLTSMDEQMKEMVKMIGNREVQKDTSKPESIISLPARVSELDME